MTDNEIKKALEWCEQFENNLVLVWKSEDKYTIALKTMQTIKSVLKDYNRLQAENEKLNAELKNLTTVIKNLTSENRNLTSYLVSANAENERLEAKCKNTQVGYNFLKDELEETKKRNRDLVCAFQTYKAEAYKEFAEKLHEELRMYGTKDKFNKAVFLNVVDKAKKEMAGEDK